MSLAKQGLDKIRQHNEGVKITGVSSKTKIIIRSAIEVFIGIVAKIVELDKDKATADKLEKYLKTVLKI